LYFVNFVKFLKIVILIATPCGSVVMSDCIDFQHRENTFAARIKQEIMCH